MLEDLCFVNNGSSKLLDRKNYREVFLPIVMWYTGLKGRILRGSVVRQSKSARGRMTDGTILFEFFSFLNRG